MRYSADHAEKTRAKVVRIAAEKMRAQGPDRVSVAEVMRKAGLTHGGFYAHFPSKDDLIAAAITEMFTDGRALIARVMEGREPEHALRAYINAYVSAQHRDKPESGCPIAALASDIHRQEKKARTAYDKGVAGLIGRIADLLPPNVTQDRKKLAASMMAEMTGAVAAARAVSDPELSESILAAARASLKARSGLPPN